MTIPTQRVAREPLPTAECLSRLDRARSGFLACSTRALPTVVPVTVHVTHGQLRLQLPDAALAEQITGQVVALSVGRPRRAWRRGWRVVARGPLADVPGHPTALVLELLELEGTTT